MPVPKRNYGGNQDYELLQAALLEQAMSQPGSGVFRPGRAPSNLAINEFIASMPRGFEQGREAAVIEDMDARTRSAFDASTARQNKLDDFRAGATARDFETRRDPTEELGPPDPQVRSIRRFGTSSVATDPDAAASAGEKAMRDPRVLSAQLTGQSRLDAAEIAAQGRIDAEKAAAQAKADAEKAKTNSADAEGEQARKEIIALANELKDSPYLNANVGVLDAMLPTVRGGSRDFQAKVDRLRNLLSLGARSKLKGQGAVSDFEGKMLASSQTALDRGTDEAAFRAELERIIGDQQRRGSTGVKRYNPATGRVE